MPVIKPKVVHIPDEVAADNAMATLAAIVRQLREIKDAANVEIDRIKAKAKADSAPLEARKKELEAGLAAFAQHNRETLIPKKRKSRQLVFGVLGFKATAEVKPAEGETWDTVLKRIKERKLSGLIVTKESVNRSAIQRLPDARLKTIGCVRVKGDEFFYKPKVEEVVSAYAAA